MWKDNEFSSSYESADGIGLVWTNVNLDEDPQWRGRYKKGTSAWSPVLPFATIDLAKQYVQVGLLA